MNDKISSVNIEVICNRDDCATYPMKIRFLSMDEGQKTNLPCNGCEYMSVSLVCMDCIAAVNKLFSAAVVDITKPIQLKK